MRGHSSDADDYIGDLNFLKPLRLGVHCVSADNWQREEAVDPGSGGRHSALFASRGIGQGDRRVRNDGAGWIGHQTGKLAGAALSKRGADTQKGENRRNQTKGDDTIHADFS